MSREYDVAEAEDVYAPEGRCYYCNQPFGRKGVDDLYRERSGKDGAHDCCDLCADLESNGWRGV